jgi:hypothetical protein
MQSLENKEKIRMTVQDHAPSSVNATGTNAKIDTPLTQPGSPDVLDQTRRDLIALRVKHGAKSPIGYRCSNIVELMGTPELPTDLIRRQMDDLQRLLGS